MTTVELATDRPALQRLAALRSSRWAALPVLMAGTFMIVLDFFIVNVALPSIATGIHAGPSALEWVVAGYGLTFATFLITAGRLGDQIGRRRTFMGGLALFTLTSAACGLAPTPGFLVAFRMLQGLAGAFISPSVLSILGVVYQGADRARAITVYGMVMGIAAAGAQLIGGVLVRADVVGLGWRGVFLINVPIGAAALLLAPALIPESRSDAPRRVDVAGTILLTAGLTAIVLPLIEARPHGWPLWTWLSLAAAPALLVAFVLHERALTRRGGAPLLDMSLFGDRSFAAGNAIQLAFWCGQASFFLVLALYLQQGLGLDPLQSGGVFTILAGAYLAASLRAPRLTMRHGRRLVVAGAMILAGGHAALFAALAMSGVTASIASIIPGLVLVGAGMGLCITPLVSTVLANVDPRNAGTASGVLATMQQVGNSLGVALIGVVFFGALNAGYAAAMRASLLGLAGLLVAVAVFARILPAPRRAA